MEIPVRITTKYIYMYMSTLYLTFIVDVSFNLRSNSQITHSLHASIVASILASICGSILMFDVMCNVNVLTCTLMS